MGFEVTATTWKEKKNPNKPNQPQNSVYQFIPLFNMHECLTKQIWGWLRDSSNMNIKNIAIASITIYSYWGTLMFWLRYGINKNNSVAKPLMWYNHRAEQVSKHRSKHPELLISISPVQLFPTTVPDRAHGVGVTSPSASQQLSQHSTTATEPQPWDFWMKKPQHKAKKLELKQGANMHNERNGEIINKPSERLGGTARGFCSPQNNWNELN